MEQKLQAGTETAEHKADISRDFFFSRKVRLGAIGVPAALSLMAVVAMANGTHLKMVLPLLLLILIAIIATVMLWTRHPLAAHTWALVAAAVGAGALLSSDLHRHDYLYWAERLAISLVLFSVAWGLLNFAKQVKGS